METPQQRAERLMVFAQEAADRKEFDTAAAAYSEVADAHGSAGDLRGRAQALVSAGAAWFNAREFEASVEIYRSARTAASEAGSAELQSWALYGESDGCAQLGRWDQVRTAAEEGIALVGDYGHDGALPSLQFLLGKALYWLDEETEALSVLEQARNTYRSRGAVASVLEVDDFTLTVLLFLADYETAIAVASRRLAASRGLGDLTLEANAARRVGEAYLAAGEPAAALPHFERARTGFRNARWSANAAICDIWLGRAHRALLETEESLTLFREAAAALEAAGWDADLRVALDELARSLAQLNRFAEAADVDSRLVQLWSGAGSAFDADSWERVTIRHLDALIRLDDPDRAAEALNHPAFSGDALIGDGSHYAFWVWATRTWVNWRHERPLDGLEAGLLLLSWEVARECGLAQGVVLEIAGHGAAPRADQAELFARALAVYVNNGAWDQAFALAQHIEGQTPFPGAPRQMWIELTGQLAS